MAGRINAKNANILGYTDEILRVSPRDPYLITLRDELEHDRYFVVLLAYDYQLARKTGQRRLLWETRFSIPETGYDFEACFPKMTAIASQYFGQDSHGLIHHNSASQPRWARCQRNEFGKPSEMRSSVMSGVPKPTVKWTPENSDDDATSGFANGSTQSSNSTD
jgi:hypothetical protein